MSRVAVIGISTVVQALLLSGDDTGSDRKLLYGLSQALPQRGSQVLQR